MANQCVLSHLISIYHILAVFLGYNAQELLIALLEMEYVVSVQVTVMGICRACLSSNAANVCVKQDRDQVTLKVRRM